MLNELSSAYGSRLVLDDHGLGPDDAVCPAPGQSRETATSWYCYMSGLHTGTSTYGWQFTLNGGSMAVAADAGVSMGACFLEFAAFQALDRRSAARSTTASSPTVRTGSRPRPDLPADHPRSRPRTRPRSRPRTHPRSRPRTHPPSHPRTHPADRPLTRADPPLTNVSAPQVTGTAAVGHTLTASPGVWSVQPDAVTYQWFRGSRLLEGATGPTYSLVAKDDGRRLRVVVTAARGSEVAQATSGWLRVTRS